MKILVIWTVFVLVLMCVLCAFGTLLGARPLSVSAFLQCEGWLVLASLLAFVHQGLASSGKRQVKW